MSKATVAEFCNLVLLLTSHEQLDCVVALIAHRDFTEADRKTVVAAVNSRRKALLGASYTAELTPQSDLAELAGRVEQRRSEDV